jgi:hydroxyacylglutathione hydrolase
MQLAVIPEKIVLWPMINYSWLIYSPISRKAIIIDPSWEHQGLEANLKKYQLDLAAILLTHGHPDHVYSVEILANTYKCPIWLHEQEFFDFGFSWPGHQFVPKGEWEVGGLLVEPIFTPGHTRGGICYKIGDHLFTGDTLFVEGCGMCFDQYSSPYDLYDSIQLIKQACYPHTKIYPGHSYGIEPGCSFETVNYHNIYLKFTEQNKFVAFRMRKNQPDYFDFQ